MANSRERNKRRDLYSEIAGIAFFALFLLSGASLIVYHTGPKNWVGIVGNNVSMVLFVLMGYTAYVFPLLFLLLSYFFLFREGLTFKLSMLLGLCVFIVASSGLLSLLDSGISAGGIAGDLATKYMEPYLGVLGTLIVLGSLWLIAIRLTTGIFLVRFVERLLAISASVFRATGWLVSKVAKREKKKEALKRPSSAPAIVTTEPPKEKTKKKEDSPEKAQQEFKFVHKEGKFTLPPLSFLDPVPERKYQLDRDNLIKNSQILEKKLRDFGVEGRVVEVRPGPVITVYEFEPAPGIKVGRIVSLCDDLALAMRSTSIRILAPIPGKAVVGIEVPNPIREKILLREILESSAYKDSPSKLTLALGKDSSGVPFVADLKRMPHLLIAGSTGAGKSVSVNAMILSILYKATPEDVRFLMIDPKMLELSSYEGIPHLLTPVVTSPKRASVMLKGMVTEMERRYSLLTQKGARNIDGYNELVEKEGNPEEKKLPYIVVVIDELADLMMTAGKEVEDSLVRLSQMARASGIHLIVATQRPSVDVITGLIKSNFPARISFQVPSKTDSRTILDTSGAESLLGEGDMLFLPPGSPKLHRVHGVFVSEREIKKVTGFLKKQERPAYEEILTKKTVKKIEEEEELGEEFIKRYNDAVRLAMEMDMISTSYIQRRLRVGYNTAARIIEKMEEEGIVGPQQGSRPREVLKKRLEE